MKEFNFSVPQNIVAGKGTIQKLPEVAAQLGGKKGFIISDPQLAKLGAVAACQAVLEKAGMEVAVFTDCEPNPSVETVDKATALYKESGADFIVAYGGGSSMDVAKAVGVLVKFGGSIVEYEGAHKVPGDIVPLIAIPTTAGTGSEVTAFSVITDHSRQYKLTVFSYKLLPAYAILDSDLISTVPASVAAACGMDALIHALEAYISTAASPFSDAMAEKAMELIGSNIRNYVANRADDEAAGAMLVGSLFAGIAFSFARLGNVHAMSHPVSAHFNVPHGVANSVLLPTIVEYNALADKGKYRKIFNYIAEIPMSADEFETYMLAEEIRNLNAILGIPENLTAVGVKEEAIPAMAEDAMKSGNIAVNPRSTRLQDVIKLYHDAM